MENEEENTTDAKEEITETKEEDVFAVDKLQDIISPARKKVMYHWNDRNPDHMFEYLASKVSMINKYLPNTREIIKRRMKDKKITLYSNTGRMSKEDWFKWWEIIEGTGEDVDQHGYYKHRGLGEQLIIQENPMVYNYNVLFGFSDMLFRKGNVNVVIGAMDSGKSSFMLGLGLNSIQLGYYKLSCNLGIQEEYEHQWLHRCIWMTELLRFISHNKIENIKHKKMGRPQRNMYINCILDEGESIMSSTSRSDDKQAGMFSKFINYCRKSDTAITFIYHDYNNFPKSLRKSSNINAIIYKGFDQEGKDLENPQKEAIIDFPSKDYSVHIDNIPPCELLDTDEWSSFDIIDDSQPDKSVDMNEVFKIAKGKSSHEVPHAILRYLDNLTFENQPFENVLGMIKKIEERIRDSYIDQCEKPKQYETILRREMELTYKIADASKIRFSEKAIKKIAQEEYDIFQVEKRKKEIDPETIDYKKCDFDMLFTFISKNKAGKIKKIVGEDYREINNSEIRRLLDNKVSRNTISYIYSYRVRKIDLFKNLEFE